jgi:hypothetical protein
MEEERWRTVMRESRRAGELPASFVVSCAWCERLSSDGETWFRPPLWRSLRPAHQRDTALTHGICPSCFSRLAPEVPYPVRA